ncbi:DMT family transporter [uncultured Bilophila sp.]|uniref:DMT family transporter n=1 Tax=uncultured Bilophila sp. TaxID=529385 RepID=UPI0026DC6EF6|nr:DMT family transporter [uncultured Bilophila sp.]
MFGLGVFLAISTAFSWALACVIHTTASKITGIRAVMLVRQPLASVVLGVCCLAAGDLWLPSMRLFWLSAVSGLFGIIIGDACLYAGALTIGLRPAQVCQSLSSCFTALFSAIYLHEFIGMQGWIGMLVATCGVILVVTSERRDTHNPPTTRKQRRKGITLSLLAAVFLALGLVFSKQALEEGIGALPLAFYRNAISTVGIWAIGFAIGAVAPAMRSLRANPGALKLFPLGCLFGPAGGIWLSCIALDYLPAAIASMLIGLQPIALLIITGIIERRVPAVNSIIGSAVACTGAAILLLR